MTSRFCGFVKLVTNLFYADSSRHSRVWVAQIWEKFKFCGCVKFRETPGFAGAPKSRQSRFWTVGASNSGQIQDFQVHQISEKISLWGRVKSGKWKEMVNKGFKFCLKLITIYWISQVLPCKQAHPFFADSSQSRQIQIFSYRFCRFVKLETIPVFALSSIHGKSRFCGRIKFGKIPGF